MRVDVERREWRTFLDVFGERNRDRPTRLEVINKSGDVSTDFWLEDGLTLTGTTLDRDGEGAPRVEIMLDGCRPEVSRHMTRTIARARRLWREEGEDGRDSALEVEDGEGYITVLRFGE